MASSFADALDLGAPPRPRRPPAPIRPGRASCWTWAAGGGRSLWPWPTPPRAQPSWPWTSMSAPSTSPPAMPPRPDTPTSTPPRPRPWRPSWRDRARTWTSKVIQWAVVRDAGREARGAGRGVAGRFIAVLSCLDHLNAVGPPGRLFRGRLSHRGVVGAGAGPTGSAGPAGPTGPAGAPPLARHHADPDPRATASGREGPNDDGGWPMRTSARPSFSWVNPRSHGPGAARWRPLRSTARTIRRRRERGPSQLPPLPHRPRITRTHTHSHAPGITFLIHGIRWSNRI